MMPFAFGERRLSPLFPARSVQQGLLFPFVQICDGNFSSLFLARSADGSSSSRIMNKERESHFKLGRGKRKNRGRADKKRI